MWCAGGCITGTPLNRGLDDLYGLFYFLHANPYSERHFWNACPAGALHGRLPCRYPGFCCAPPCEHMQKSALLVSTETTQ